MPTSPATDTKVSALPPYSTAHAADLILVVDTTDTSAAPTGTNKAVTLGTLLPFTPNSLMGNPTTSSAAPSAITLGTNLSFIGSTLNASGSGGSTNPYVFLASQNGVPAIANTANPQAGPDGTTALAALFAKNAPGGPLAGLAIEIVIDIPILCANISVNSYTTVRGMGQFEGPSPPSGLWMRANVTNGTDTCILKNANWRSPYLGATIVDQDITIKDLYLDGQRRNNVSGYSLQYITSTGMMLSPLQFWGVNNLKWLRLTSYDSCAFHASPANINGFVIDDFYMVDPTWLAGQTAFRFNGITAYGPGTNWRWHNLYGITGDDFVALATGGYNLFTTISIPGTQGPQSFGGFQNVYCGAMTDIIIDGLQPYSSVNFAAIYTAEDPRTNIKNNMTGITIKNVNGWSDCAFAAYTLLGNASVKKNILISDINIRTTGILFPDGSYGWKLGGKWSDLTIQNVVTFNTNFFFQLQSDFVCTALNIINLCNMNDSGQSATPGTSPIGTVAGVSVDELNLIGCRWNRFSTTVQAFITINGGTINLIKLDGCSFNNIAWVAAIITGTVGCIQTSGLSHRGAGGHGSINVGQSQTLARLRSASSNTALLVELVGTPPGVITSKKTDATEDA